MDKGIRPAVLVKFAELNELRRAGQEPYIGPKANTRFRADVNAWLEQEFNITHAAACTHYNYALQKFKVEQPALVEGLGRPPEKNNGGRKKKVAVVTTAVAPQPILLLTYTPSIPLDALLQPPQVPLLPDVQPVEELTPEGVEQTEWVVKRKKDGAIVAEGLTLEAARAMVQRAAAQKKAALYFV